ncbi:hypothetical protein [Chryseobacterium turcicum]|uniref:Uncharacterized protein n=1 Tax=Chryseobacterium turcicum TaxID=2898076 RepID=A0A9Q3V1C5_9FLAO|nr:hypothetical protein [Chryseobacterium turcicum]MCD1115309.1 hypothetical protein [Chryseobacterium turcicum]
MKTYTYSICHPDKKEIEYKKEILSSKNVLEIAQNYQWMELLEFSDSLGKESVYYNPSLDFTCVQDGKSFGLTSEYNKDKKLEFSLWYNRPKNVKILFGLLGSKDRMVLDDIWSIDFQTALQYLECFVNGNHEKIENLFLKS